MASDEVTQSFFTDYNLACLEIDRVICEKYDVNLEIIDLDKPIHNYDDFWDTFVPGDVLVTNSRLVFLKLEGFGGRWVDSQGVQITDKDLFFKLVFRAFYGDKIKLAHVAAQSF
jgi:hypothetical protein